MARRKVTKKPKKTPRKQKSKQLKTRLLPMNAENLDKLRTVLFFIHNKIESIMDVMIICTNSLQRDDTEQNEEMGNVLQKHTLDPLFGELVELRYTIRQLGGNNLFALTKHEDADEDEESRNTNDRSFA